MSPRFGLNQGVKLAGFHHEYVSQANNRLCRIDFHFTNRDLRHHIMYPVLATDMDETMRQYRKTGKFIPVRTSDPKWMMYEYNQFFKPYFLQIADAFFLDTRPMERINNLPTLTKAISDAVQDRLMKIKVDLFLHYPRQRDRRSRAKFLSVPTPYQIKQGAFICTASRGVKFAQVLPENGARNIGIGFIDPAGNYHDFMRDWTWRELGHATPEWIDVDPYSIEYQKLEYFEHYTLPEVEA